MSNRSIFLIMVAMIFVAVMTVGLTLIFKDKTKEALDVFTGGGFFTFFIMLIGLPFIVSEED